MFFFFLENKAADVACVLPLDPLTTVMGRVERVSAFCDELGDTQPVGFVLLLLETPCQELFDIDCLTREPFYLKATSWYIRCRGQKATVASTKASPCGLYLPDRPLVFTLIFAVRRRVYPSLIEMFGHLCLVASALFSYFLSL